MRFLYSFCRRITDDLKQKKLIPLKILFFVHASTLFVLYPYLTIHMRELGINVEEAAIMSAVTPVVSIVMPPLAGMLADKIGNFRLLLAFSSGLGGLSALLLLLVPVGRIKVTFPPAVELLASCGVDGLQLHTHRDQFCQPKHLYSYKVDMEIPTCGFVCTLPYELSAADRDDIVNSQSYEVQLEWHQMLYRHAVSNSLPLATPPTKYHATRKMNNQPYLNTTVSRILDDQLFFPVPKLFQLQCDYENNTCSLGQGDVVTTSAIESQEKYNVWVSYEARKEQNDVKEFWVALSDGNSTKKDYQVSCIDNYLKVHDAKGIIVQTTSRELGDCSAACITTIPRKVLCENMEQHVEIDPVFTFWIYLAVRVFIGIISGTAFAMFEGAVISIVREQQADYGLQRLYGSIGGMISSPLSGLLIDYASRGKGYTDFRPAFYLYAVLKVASGFLMLSIDLQFKQPAQNLLTDVISVFKNIEMVALLIACFVLGTAWGFIESWLFWLLQDMGASRWLMGITITVGGIAGLPLLVLSGPIIRKLGHANVLFIGFVFYAIRLLGYSLIYTPWLCLVFEALESVTSSLSFTAAVTYAAQLSSTSTDTSVQGLLGGLYYGVGKGSGSLIGGYLMKFFGDRPTYQIFAGATFITGCIYFLFNKFYLRKRVTRGDSDTCKKKPTELDVECRETGKDVNVANMTVDVAKVDAHKASNIHAAQITHQSNIKSSTDSTDGGSDSGVDNPAYNDSEPANDPRKDDNKIDG
ncbi:uncharacterized protein LOC128680397 [Plodia interpunctella]|uniref:uncharacterized protein LOC128680397 n=1 Tax=Plodia interpunctella TaxID=58824 RepID=UPI002368CCBD|nr:uncharacterized protein LOC128680397 [Plodia interpunctella]